MTAALLALSLGGQPNFSALLWPGTTHPNVHRARGAPMTKTERSTDRIADLPSSADRKADSRAIIGTLAARPVRSGRSIRDVPCQGQAYGVVDECLGECG